jgi:hypothetical protein
VSENLDYALTVLVWLAAGRLAWRGIVALSKVVMGLMEWT